VRTRTGSQSRSRASAFARGHQQEVNPLALGQNRPLRQEGVAKKDGRKAGATTTHDQQLNPQAARRSPPEPAHDRERLAQRPDGKRPSVAPGRVPAEPRGDREADRPDPQAREGTARAACAERVEREEGFTRRAFLFPLAEEPEPQVAPSRRKLVVLAGALLCRTMYGPAPGFPTLAGRYRFNAHPAAGSRRARIWRGRVCLFRDASHRRGDHAALPHRRWSRGRSPDRVSRS
jgi:hypothetical protein